MGLAIVYTGERRFEKMGRENHNKLWQHLSELIPFKIIDKCKEDRKNDDFKLSGPNQIWDFYKAIDDVEEDIVIKMRTDVWFAERDMPYVINDILSVVNGDKDFLLIGSELKNHFKSEYSTYPIYWPEKKVGKTTDFLLVTKKDALRKKQDVYKELVTENSKSGNILWQRIKKAGKKGFYSCGQVYLLRAEYKNTNDYYIAYQFSKHYGKKHQPAINYYYERIPSDN